MPKICVFKKCKSDQRRHPWIKWATFVSPLKLQNVERAKKWLQLVGRPDYTIERLKLPRQSTNTFICEDHFPEEDHDNLDWKTNPNLTPFPADTDLDALHIDSSEIDEEIANPPLDKNDMKTDKHFKKNMKKEKHFKKKDFKANFPMDSQKGNSWEIQSIYDLQFYICPVCRYTNSSKQDFVNHASNVHPEAIENFENIIDGSLEDIECPWKIESIDLKEEICENPESPENIENIMIKVEPMDLDNAIDKISQQNKNISTTKSEFSRTGRRMTHKCETCGFLLPTKHSLNNHIQKRHANLETKANKNVEIVTPQVESGNESIVSEVNIKLDNESDLNDYIRSDHHSYTKNNVQSKSSAKNSSNISQSNFQNESNEEINKNESVLNEHMKSNHPMKQYAYPRSGPNSIRKINAKSKTISQITKSDFATSEISASSEEEEEQEKQDVSQILNQCGICDKKLDNLLELNNHMKSEHSMGSQKIEIKESQKIHIKKANVKNFICQECGEKFVQYQKLKKHFRSVHTNLETLECHICQTVSSSQQKLLRHINHEHFHEIQPKKFYKDLPKETRICEFCSKVYSAKNASHVKDALNKHIKKVHHGIQDPKNAICDTCGKAMTKDYLEQHRKSHIPQNLRPFECDKCHKKYLSQNELNKHTDRVHNQIRTHVCQHMHCGRAFFDQIGLSRHVIISHEGKKPHKCFKCGKGHSTAGNMRIHVKKCNDFKNPEMVQN